MASVRIPPHAATRPNQKPDTELQPMRPAQHARLQPMACSARVLALCLHQARLRSRTTQLRVMAAALTVALGLACHPGPILDPGPSPPATGAPTSGIGPAPATNAPLPGGTGP